MGQKHTKHCKIGKRRRERTRPTHVQQTTNGGPQSAEEKVERHTTTTTTTTKSGLDLLGKVKGRVTR